MCSRCKDEYLQHVFAYPSTMSSPYFTGNLVEAVVEMFSCSGEYIGHGWLTLRGGWVRSSGARETGRGKEGKGGERCWSNGARGGKEEKEGEGSAEPQLHPLMLHVSVCRSATCPALQSDKERINTKISGFTQVGLSGRSRIQMQFIS